MRGFHVGLSRTLDDKNIHRIQPSELVSARDSVVWGNAAGSRSVQCRTSGGGHLYSHTVCGLGGRSVHSQNAAKTKRL